MRQQAHISVSHMWPAIPLLGMISIPRENHTSKDTCTPMFTAALFTRAGTRTQPSCPSARAGKDVPHHMMQCYSVLKRKAWCWSWNSNPLATWCKELTHWKRPWCWERLKAGAEGDARGWDVWMASPTRWTWVWVNSGSWWWTGKPGVLQSVGSQSWTRLSDWTELNLGWSCDRLWLIKCRRNKVMWVLSLGLARSYSFSSHFLVSPWEEAWSSSLKDQRSLGAEMIHLTRSPLN